ncbi:zinc ribbon domain-containing protein [Mycolicibacterium sp. P1-18]|uniref:zinc ribbon domain-containing protein n=1 Tax=Mycolicibacterium sp. P1-18 TaxID=2024615 RepID=UPI0011F16294|nr:zinc ribbon domain-containing protein [Mycolicibacterium sp. P1-18]KAA0094666.1 zinc ribbon domain-containing protein [Mycolicibacterium sp. P1-18]
MTTMTCRVCAVIVPTDEFCGNCGATASPRRGDGPSWLRLSAYAAAPGERVLRPAVVSTVFPALPRHSRVAFGVALVIVVALLVGTALPMWVAALIGVVGAGLPAVFLAYLKASHTATDSSALALVVVALLGIAGGVGWSIATDVAAARVDDDALGLPASTLDLLLTCLAIPVGFLVLLLAPTIVVRVWRPGAREPLRGLTIGAFGAICFVTAGSMAALAPELTGGPIADSDGQSASDLVIGGLVQGVAVPLTAAAVAGAIGATLWFVPRRDTGHPPRWYWPTSPLPSIAFGLVAYLGLGVLDFLSPPSAVETTVYAVLTVLALSVLRVVAHTTMLHSRPTTESESADDVVTCPECEHVVPGLPFCPRCGVARFQRPAPETKTSTPRLLVTLAAVVVLVAAGSTALSVWLTPPEALVVCPPDCGMPPISKPVSTNPRFTSDDGQFSVSYPGPETAYDATFEPNGVVLDLLAGDGGTLRLFGQPANGQTPRQIADDMLREHYPDATFDYEIPNAFVGYQLGYGEVADDYPADAIGDDERNRILVMVGVKNDYALIAAAAGPFREFTPEFGSGHPSGANFFLALDMAKYVNSFTWRGDPPR